MWYCFMIYVRLNLFNYVLALFLAKFVIIQHLETLYLGGNNIRVECERVWRFDQECATRRWITTGLVTDSWVVTCQKWSTRVKYAGRWRIKTVGPLHDKSTVWPNLITCDWNLQHIPVAKWLASTPCFVEKLLFTFHLIPYYKYPYTHKI